ncbi:MAG: hypothetical protein ACHQAQ_13275 [Hyphomicrobiales bacterium]
MTTIIAAVIMVAALVLLSVLQKGFEPMSILTLVLFGLPLGLVVAAPVSLVILPVADAILERRDMRLFRDMTIIGALAGALVPLFIMFVLKFRPPGMIGTITALMVLAGLVGGGAAGLFYAEVLARMNKR